MKCCPNTISMRDQYSPCFWLCHSQMRSIQYFPAIFFCPNRNSAFKYYKLMLCIMNLRNYHQVFRHEYLPAIQARSKRMLQRTIYMLVQFRVFSNCKCNSIFYRINCIRLYVFFCHLSKLYFLLNKMQTKKAAIKPPCKKYMQMGYFLLMMANITIIFPSKLLLIITVKSQSNSSLFTLFMTVKVESRCLPFFTAYSYSFLTLLR